MTELEKMEPVETENRPQKKPGGGKPRQRLDFDRGTADDYEAVDALDEWRKGHPWLTSRQLQMRYLRTSHDMRSTELGAAVGVPYRKIVRMELGDAWSDEIYWKVIRFFYETDCSFRDLLIAQHNAIRGVHRRPPCA